MGVVGSNWDNGQSITVQADGKILLGGYNSGNGWDFALVRYNTDGSLDTSFDTDGKVTTDLDSSEDFGHSVTMQADGKILVSGSSYNSSDYDYDFALVRYNADGSLDISFDSDGKVTTGFGISADYSASFDEANSITVQTDGKILLGGESESSFALVRYNSDG
ncbi:MAG: delta-60 repeat domain-containing protein, partial [Methylovulum sp.]|nr:delta-60 repeat domain-containing protein [Methylovulum sp.]